MKSGEYDVLIREAVEMYMPDGYDWRLYKSQIFIESSFDPLAVSHVGAMGLAQMMPATWGRYGSGDPFDPFDSLVAGARYMSYLLGQWDWPRPDIDRSCLAMASYNAGIGHILTAQKKSGDKSLYSEIISELPKVTGRHSEETIHYVQKILAVWCREVTVA